MNDRKTIVGDSGFIRLLDVMGTDSSITDAARVSYAAGTKTVREDSDLLRFLMRHEHYSPFSMAQIKFHIRLPIFVHNQFIRHDRFHWNVMSARYSVMPEEKWCPSSDEVRGQGQGNKQVGNGQLPAHMNNHISGLIDLTNDRVQSVYEDLLASGCCREQARTVLPQGQYTEAYVTANLGDWLLFLKQRLDFHAQKEIRDYAIAIRDILRELFPVTIQAFEDYQLESVRFSKTEYNMLLDLISNLAGTNIGRTLSWDECIKANIDIERLTNKRERQEFLTKLGLE